jgi:hypothetical protein
MFYMWRRLNVEQQQRIWRLYGWFSGLMLCGSCFGALTWAARILNLANGFKSNDSFSSLKIAQGYSSLALGRSWRAAFNVTYAIEFLCLSAAKLMVFERMWDFAVPHGHSMRKRWVLGGHAVMIVVVFCNAVGVAANVTAAVYTQKSADAYRAASLLYVANNTQVIDKYVSSGRTENELAFSIASVQSFCEVVALLLIVAAFLVAGVLCARRVSSALSVLDSSGPEMAAGIRVRQQLVGVALALGRQLRREITITTGFVFVAFVLRSMFSTMHAVAYQLQDSAKKCPGVVTICDASCNNVFTHITQWMAHTPEFQGTVVLISSPLALLVALWGVTSRLTLQLMRSRNGGMALSGQDLLLM